MAAVPDSTQVHPSASSSPSHRLESAELQTSRPLETELQHLVERAAMLVEAQRASLVVLDPASEAPDFVTTWPQSLSGPQMASLSVHEVLAHWVIRQQTPAFIADGANDPTTRALGLRVAGSLLSVPLCAGQQVLGALTLSSPSIGAFGQHHLRLLELVADVGGLALFEARQFNTVAQKNKQLTRLLEVACDLGTTPDTRMIMGLTVSALRQLFLCEEAVLYRYEVDTDTLCGAAGWGTRSPQLADVRIGVSDPQSVTAWVAKQRRPFLQSRGATGFVGRTTGALLAQRELELLAVPVVAWGHLWGVITLARAVPFEPGDLRTLLTLSQLIAPPLVRARKAQANWPG